MTSVTLFNWLGVPELYATKMILPVCRYTIPDKVDVPVKVRLPLPDLVKPPVPAMGALIKRPPALCTSMLGVVPASVKLPLAPAAIVCDAARFCVVMLLTVTFRLAAIVAVPAVAVAPVAPNCAVSAFVNVNAAGVAVPAEEVVQLAVVVSHAPFSVPKPALVPLRSK
jgi:hypothetical protein